MNSVLTPFIKATELLEKLAGVLEMQETATKCANLLKEAKVIAGSEVEETINTFLNAPSAEAIEYTTNRYLENVKRKEAGVLGKGVDEDDKTAASHLSKIDSYLLNKHYNKSEE